MILDRATDGGVWLLRNMVPSILRQIEEVHSSGCLELRQMSRNKDWGRNGLAIIAMNQMLILSPILFDVFYFLREGILISLRCKLYMFDIICCWFYYRLVMVSEMCLDTCLYCKRL